MAIGEILSGTELLTAAISLCRIVAIIVVAIILLRIAGIFVDRLFATSLENRKFYVEEKRIKTLSVLLKSVLRYTMYFIAGIMILREFRIDTTSILAGAGIVGLAVGVGAQSIVKDVITGFFIIFEDQFAVGDYITTVDLSGTVEEIGFRIIKLRDLNGVLHIVPNGSIGRVTNFTRGTMQATVNIPVAYEVDVGKARQMAEEAVREIKAEMSEVLKGPWVVGIVDFDRYGLTLRIIANVVPLKQVKVETALRQRIKQKFDSSGIYFVSRDV